MWPARVLIANAVVAFVGAQVLAKDSCDFFATLLPLVAVVAFLSAHEASKSFAFQVSAEQSPAATGRMKSSLVRFIFTSMKSDSTRFQQTLGHSRIEPCVNSEAMRGRLPDRTRGKGSSHVSIYS